MATLGLTAGDRGVLASHTGYVMGAVPAVAAAATSDSWWRTAERGPWQAPAAGDCPPGDAADWGPEARNRLRRRPDATGNNGDDLFRRKSSGSDVEDEGEEWQSVQVTPQTVRYL